MYSLLESDGQLKCFIRGRKISEGFISLRTTFICRFFPSFFPVSNNITALVTKKNVQYNLISKTLCN